MIDLSILISACNEEPSFLEETVRSIYESADIHNFEVIICDDGSRAPIKEMKDVRVVRHEKNIGVGAAFMTAASHAQSDNLFIMGADIRFEKNGWMEAIGREINENPKAVTCTSCVGLNTLTEDNMKISVRRNVSRRTGSTILIFHDKKSHPKKHPTFRNIIEAQWIKQVKGMEPVEIPCVLGAAYGVKKEWLEYLDVWTQHRAWGTLEPGLSLASWLFGGSCRVAPAIEVGHVFNRSGNGEDKAKYLVYNKIMLASLLFDDYDRDRLIQFLGDAPEVKLAKGKLKSLNGEIEAKREEYKKKTVYDVREYVKRFEIDFRE